MARLHHPSPSNSSPAGSFGALGPERRHLAKQVQAFKHHAKKLKKIFKETVRVLSDLQDFDESLSIDSILALEAQKCISNVVSGRTALVVFGETRLRSCIVNEILGEAILPLPWESNEDWRLVHFKHRKHRVMSHVRDGYDLASDKSSHQSLPFSRIPRENICLSGPGVDPAYGDATLEVGLHNPILEAGFEIICSATEFGSLQAIKKTLQVCQVELHPFFIYGHDAKNKLTEQQCGELEMLRRLMPDVPLLFALMSQDGPAVAIAAAMGRRGSFENPALIASMNKIYEQLCKLGYLNDVTLANSIPIGPPAINPHDLPSNNPELSFSFVPVDTMVANFIDFTPELLNFVQCNMRQQITSAASSLHDAHARCLQTLILYAHDLARDVMVTPRRIKYCRQMEEKLYTQLIELASRKQSDIKEIVGNTIQHSVDDIVKEIVDMELEGVNLEESGAASDAKTLRHCITLIQDHIFRKLSNDISSRLVSSVNYLRESVIGTLKRVVEGLEETTEETPMEGESSRALKHILDSAYTLEFNERTSTSTVRLFMERIKHQFSGPSYKTLNLRDPSWREKYTRHLVESLSASRLAKGICAQFRSKVSASHDSFLAAMKQLENRHSGRLKETEGQRETIRKSLTPKMARLSLSSVALRDGIVHGLPVTGRELGRGQYGVVFQCAEWAGKGPLAVKSVVPPDEKHWNDLALEFHYTWTLPRNDRVVNLVGALIDDDYSSGSSAVVLFIMPRYPRDLHSALKVGLDFGSRMQIALDVVEGIRFLHGQGLLHRDIKLKNVLLDGSNRGTLTDLGFCKPEAMMTCTIVGTPIHMAPELFGGLYDSAVDIYAFGILFWYICSNDTKLPGAFDACQNKEQLWTAVRKGLRPERLPRFDADCWELMINCWEGDLHARPLVGDIAQVICQIMKRIGRRPLT